MKPLWFLSFLLLISCVKDPSSISTKTNLPEDELWGNIPFNNYFHRTGWFSNPSNLPTLFVLRSREDEEAYFGWYFPPYRHYQDSMLIGIVYGPKISVSTSFRIDSLVADSTTIHAYSHLYYPLAQMAIFSYPNHFVSLPKSSKKVILEDVQLIHEPLTGEIIPFRTFFKEDGMIHANSNDPPRLIVLRSKAEELAFLDTTQTAPAFVFPQFDYTDSMLIGIKLPNIYSSGDPYDILMVIRRNNDLNVIFHIWFPLVTEPDLVAPGHFIALQKMDINVRMTIEYLW